MAFKKNEIDIHKQFTIWLGDKRTALNFTIPSSKTSADSTLHSFPQSDSAFVVDEGFNFHPILIVPTPRLGVGLKDQRFSTMEIWGYLPPPMQWSWKIGVPMETTVKLSTANYLTKRRSIIPFLDFEVNKAWRRGKTCGKVELKWWRKSSLKNKISCLKKEIEIFLLRILKVASSDREK